MLPHEFPTTRSSYRLKSGRLVRRAYRLSYCHHCLNEQKYVAEYRLRERTGPRERKHSKEQRRRNNALPSSKAAKRRYRKTRKGKTAERWAKKRAQYKKLGLPPPQRGKRYAPKPGSLEARKLEASLPVQVIKPVVDQMVKVVGGRPALARITKVPERRLYDIAHEKVKGVSVPTCDLLALHSDFTLGELTNRAEEWALLTGDSWPFGYRRWLGEVGVGIRAWQL